jgi:hypothetical protein
MMLYDGPITCPEMHIKMELDRQTNKSNMYESLTFEAISMLLAAMQIAGA